MDYALTKFHFLMALVTFCIVPGFAVAQPSFDQDTLYDVYYELSSERANVLPKVKVLGVEIIHGQKFFKVTGESFAGQKKTGFVTFDSVKAILPSDSIVSVEDAD